MNGYAYPLAVDTWDERERDAAKRVIDSGRCTMGEEVEAFEEEFARHVGAKHAIMVNSGSSANLLAAACGFHGATGDNIIVSALTWPTTVWPIIQRRYVPHFVDVDLDTMCMSPKAALAARDEHTRGVFYTRVLATRSTKHDRDAIAAIAPTIEDACEALDGGPGDYPHTSTFSFYFAHHVSTIEGGMIATNDDPRPYKSMRSHGWSRGIYPPPPGLDPRFAFVGEGYNCKPTEIAAAVGRVQIRRLRDMLTTRAHVAMLIDELLPEWIVGSPYACGWMMFPMRVRRGAPMTRNEVVALLEANGVETRPIIGGNLLRHPAFTSHFGHTPNADEIHEQGLMIGCPPGVTDAGRAALERAFAAMRVL